MGDLGKRLIIAHAIQNQTGGRHDRPWPLRLH